MFRMWVISNLKSSSRESIDLFKKSFCRIFLKKINNGYSDSSSRSSFLPIDHEPLNWSLILWTRFVWASINYILCHYYWAIPHKMIQVEQKKESSGKGLASFLLLHDDISCWLFTLRVYLPRMHSTSSRIVSHVNIVVSIGVGVRGWQLATPVLCSASKLMNEWTCFAGGLID